MCTAITLTDSGHFFGRNLDVERAYGEQIIITPRNYTLSFRKTENMTHHYAIIGVGIEERGYPLYFDGANEHGLCMAGLNFVGNAKYTTPKANRINVSPFEFIPYILAKCKSLSEARSELKHINLTDIPFSRELPLAELHWIIADKNEAITVEQTENGLNVYENPVGVLTNNPPFPFHLQNLRAYIGLSNKSPSNRFSSKIRLDLYSRGLGAIGMPGDLSSSSRFVRAAFAKLNSPRKERTEESIGQLFHALSFVEQVEGCVMVEDKFERTEYSSVINLDTLTYYYRTYENSRICAVRLFSEDTDSTSLISYNMSKAQSIGYQN